MRLGLCFGLNCLLGVFRIEIRMGSSSENNGGLAEGGKNKSGEHKS